MANLSLILLTLLLNIKIQFTFSTLRSTIMFASFLLRLFEPMFFLSKQKSAVKMSKVPRIQGTKCSPTCPWSLLCSSWRWPGGMQVTSCKHESPRRARKSSRERLHQNGKWETSFLAISNEMKFQKTVENQLEFQLELLFKKKMIHLPNYYKYNGYCCLVAYFPTKTSIQSQSSPEKLPPLYRCRSHTP